MAQITTLAEGVLDRPLARIEDKVQVVTQYVDKWLQFQSLWDLEAEHVYQVSCN